ncbi:MAG: MFS transporter [Proteobacteria bacterium]|nr:MFS transporter [Pseudomonadota bacterium]
MSTSSMPATAPADDFRATALPIAAATFASLIGLGMLAPAMPIIARETGSDVTAAGLMIGSFGVARLLLASPSGLMTDRIGAARTAMAGLVVLALASFAGFFAKSFAPLVLSIAAQGAGSSLFATAAMTALVLKAGPQHRGRAMTWFQTAILLSFSVGPVIGGQAVSLFGSHVPFLVQGVLAAAALFAVRLMPQTAGARPQAAAATAPGVNLWTIALLAGSLGAFAAFFSRIAVAWNIVPVVALSTFAMDPSTLGWIIGAGTALNLAAMPVLPRLIDDWGARPTFLLSATVNAVAVLALYLLPSVAMLWIATAVVLLATGVMIPAATTLALTGAAPQTMGRLMGLVRTAGDTGMAIGPIVVPAFVTFGGFNMLAGLFVCLAVTLVPLAAVFGLRPRATT